VRVLAFDTAGPVIGVALVVDGTIWQRTERVTRGAEARLVPWAQSLCRGAGVSLSSLDGVGVARGPGAFTGVRVGLSTALGIAVSAGVPVWGEMSLTSRARRVGPGWVLSMLDARKGRVYAALFHDGELKFGPDDVHPEGAIAWAGTRDFVATGEGAIVYRDLVGKRRGVVAADADDPAVDWLARISADAIGSGAGMDAGEVRPLYLREPDAKPSQKR
jgi:tRNA threonylcarbamoyladenosine biosynthesis protein TsaB